MASDYEWRRWVFVPKVLNWVLDFIPDTIEPLVESNMHGAAGAQWVVCSDCFQVQDPVGDVDAASEGNYDFL